MGVRCSTPIAVNRSVDRATTGPTASAGQSQRPEHSRTSTAPQRWELPAQRAPGIDRDV
jgi:hypothetical protein